MESEMQTYTMPEQRTGEVVPTQTGVVDTEAARVVAEAEAITQEAAVEADPRTTEVLARAETLDPAQIARGVDSDNPAAVEKRITELVAAIQVEATRYGAGAAETLARNQVALAV
jgi:hypothetical protein